MTTLIIIFIFFVIYGIGSYFEYQDSTLGKMEKWRADYRKRNNIKKIMTLKKEAREAMNRALPELLELKWGCEFMATEVSSGKKTETTGTFLEYWADVAPNYFRKFWYRTPGGVTEDYSHHFDDDNTLTSLGTPPNIGDVLRAIEPRFRADSIYLFKNKNRPYLAIRPLNEGIIPYNLSAPFTDQSDEFYSFLIDILK